MKTINLAARRGSGALSGLASWSKRDERKAQETVVNALNKVLDNRFVLLQSVRLVNDDHPIPMILVGPTGVWAINQSFLKGIFRASGETWEEMDNQARVLRPAKVNLITQTLDMAGDVQNFLTSSGVELPRVDAALFFLNPGAHIDLSNPAVRLVLFDSVGRFGAGLLQQPVLLAPADIRQITELLVNAQAGAVVSGEIRDAYSMREVAIAKPRKPIISSELANELATVGQDEPEILKKVSRRAAFSTRQWVLLGLLFLVNVILLIALVLFILVSA